MPKSEPSRRQAEILRFLLTAPGCPSVREVSAALGVRAGSANNHLWELRRKGYVAWEPGRSRTVRLVAVPVFGPPPEGQTHPALLGFTRPGR